MVNEYIRKQDAIDVISIDGINCHEELVDIWAIERIPAADVVPVVRCKDCIHNNDCDIQYSAQAGKNFFCGFGENEKDVREDVYE